MKKRSISVLLLLAALVFFGCNIDNPISDISDTSDEQSIQTLVLSPASSGSTGSSYVYSDPVSRTVVFVDDSGAEIPIQSDEKSGTVVCTEVTDYLLFEDEPATSRSAGFERNHAKAFVLGKRSDGYTGLWVIYSDGRVHPVINSEGFDTTKLLEMVEGRQPLSAYFNWDYNAVEMISNDDESEIIIIGYAENNGVDRHNYTIEEGTTIGVYWAVTLDEDGYYHISRAKVIGFKDPQAWKDSYRYSKKSDGRSRHRWMWNLRMFFMGWYDYYLVMTERIEAGDNAGEYNVYGTDQEGETAVAVVTAKDVLSIEKYEVQEPSEPPNQIIGPASVIQIPTGSTAENPYILTLTVDGVVDESDPIEFAYSIVLNSNNIPIQPPLFSFDTAAGTATIVWDAAYEGMLFDLEFWTERGDLQSEPYKIRFFFKYS